MLIRSPGSLSIDLPGILTRRPGFAASIPKNGIEGSHPATVIGGVEERLPRDAARLSGCPGPLDEAPLSESAPFEITSVQDDSCLVAFVDDVSER